MKKQKRVNRLGIANLSGVKESDVKRVFEAIAQCLVNGESVHILNFGSFNSAMHKGGRSFLLGKEMIVEDYRYVRFKPSVRLSSAMKNVDVSDGACD